MLFLDSSTKKLQAADWPELLGPTRNGIVQPEVEFSAAWEKELPANWQVKIGSGFASPLVVDGRVLLFQRDGGEEHLAAYAIETGRLLWKTGWPSDFEPQINYDEGPRSTPAVADGVAVCFGAAGDAAGIDITTGRKLWHRPLRKELGARDGYFGAGSSPIIVDNLAIICVGSRNNAGVVALDLRTGTTEWKSTNFESSYASPVLFSRGGTQRLLAVMQYNTVLLDPLNGKQFEDIAFGSRGPTVNAATPVAVGDQFWLSANYGVGTTILDATASKLEKVVEKSSLLSCHYNTPVFTRGRLFGIDGYEGRGNVCLRAIDTASRKIVWQSDDFGTAHLLVSGSNLLALKLDGELVRIDAASDDYTPIQSTSISRPGHLFRALPAVYENSLIVRTNMNNYGAGAVLMRIKL